MSPAEILAWRAALGWSQAEAARQLGIGLRTYQRYEAGEAPIERRTQLACWALMRAPLLHDIDAKEGP